MRVRYTLTGKLGHAYPKGPFPCTDPTSTALWVEWDDKSQSFYVKREYLEEVR